MDLERGVPGKLMSTEVSMLFSLQLPTHTEYYLGLLLHETQVFALTNTDALVL